MSRPSIELVPMTGTGRRSAVHRRGTVQLASIHADDHFTRLWPATGDTADVVFRLAMLPARLIALALLRATSTPSRLAVIALTGAVTAAVIYVR